MQLFLTKRRGDSFVVIETLPLSGFEDVFEGELAREGKDLRLLVGEAQQEVAMTGIILPAFNRSGLPWTQAIKSRVRESLDKLSGQLGRDDGVSAGEVAAARDAASLLGTLMRARKPLAAIVAG